MRHKILLLALFNSITLYAVAFSNPVISEARYSVQNTTSKADSISVQELQSLISSGSNVQIVDVRLTKDFDKTQVIPSANWYANDQVSQWGKQLDKNKPVVVYCVHGHKVSQQVVDQLRKSGFSAQRLQGGIEAWKSNKGITIPIKE